MKKLVTVTSDNIINDLREYNDITLLYPLKSFCVGFLKEFDISKINGYIFINRLLDNKSIEELKTLFSNSNMENIQGIVFDDLGILELVKDFQFKKILLLSHLANNVVSINYYLEYVDSVVVSNDISEEEIKYILNNANKELVINVFGLNNLMYSRRNLLTNYQKYHNLQLKPYEIVSINDKKFRIFENNYGTVFYSYNYFNALSLLNEENVCFYWYNPLFLDDEDVINIINNKVNITDVDRGFLDKKSIYKLKDGD